MRLFTKYAGLGIFSEFLIPRYIQYPGRETDTGLGVHRAQFIDALVSFLPQGISHFDKKCISVKENSDGVTVSFEDGTKHTADIVIGCDGIRSVVRTAVLGKEVQAKFTRTVAYRGLIPEKNAVEALGPGISARPHCYVGPDRVRLPQKIVRIRKA